MNTLKITSLFLICLINSYSFSAVVHVDQSATGTNDGTSWANAYVELTDAISAANSGDAIWIAAGNYHPDWNGSTHTGDRILSFTPPANVSLYGGFSGTETALSQRDWKINLTVLDGDLNGDDVVTFPTTANNTENSARLMLISTPSVGITLDGLIFENGNNNLTWGGSGIASAAPDAIINNCIFRHNTSAATVETAAGRLTFENCLFYENECGFGASIFTHDLGVTMTNCTVVNNSSSSNPAGLGNLSYLQGSEITNCIIWGNTGSAATTEKNQINENSDPNGLPIFENNIIEGYTGTLQYMGSATNASLSPSFTNVSVNDYSLLSGSPAIDMGDNSFSSASIDLNLNSRISNGTIDIGAFEFQSPLNIISQQDQSLLNIYPNPVQTKMVISSKYMLNAVSVFNSIGEMIMTQIPNDKETTLNTSTLSNGIYFVKVELANGSISNHPIMIVQ